MADRTTPQSISPLKETTRNKHTQQTHSNNLRGRYPSLQTQACKTLQTRRPHRRQPLYRVE